MRIDLKVPCEEREKVKALGAKWDLARKVWFVQNAENLEPFLPWMPEKFTRPAKIHGGKK